MIKGLFRKDRLLAVIKDFIYFPDNSDKDLKIVCRYPQFFAANKLYENIKAHLRPEGDGKGGTYFGATGCGKSYTMLLDVYKRQLCMLESTIETIASSLLNSFIVADILDSPNFLQDSTRL